MKIFAYDSGCDGRVFRSGDVVFEVWCWRGTYSYRKRQARPEDEALRDETPFMTWWHDRVTKEAKAVDRLSYDVALVSTEAGGLSLATQRQQTPCRARHPARPPPSP